MIIIPSLKLGFGTLSRPGSGLAPFGAGIAITGSSLLLMIFTKPMPRVLGQPVFTGHETKIYLMLIGVFVGWIVDQLARVETRNPAGRGRARP